MREEAKAVQEVAKTTSNAIDATRELGGFLSKYAGGSIEQAIGIVEDKLKYLRWERQVRLIERANLFLNERGLKQPSRQVPLNIAIPILQGASLEDNDELQDKWAALLTNAADASTDIEARRAFISILENLALIDAKILEKIYSPNLKPESDSGDPLDIWTAWLPDHVRTEKPEEVNIRLPVNIEVSLGNIARLGLITSAMAFGNGFEIINQTAIGREFVRACSRSGNNR